MTDGTDPVNASTINAKIDFLASRDQYLFDQLGNYTDKTLVVSYNNPLAGNYANGTPVYFNTDGGTAVLTAAIASYGQSPNNGHLVPNNSAFVFGLVSNVYSDAPNPYKHGDVYVYGLVPNLDLTSILDTDSYTGNPPATGPIYLSSTEAGKLTITPSPASVFIGYVVSDTSIFLSPNVDSLNQLYFNYRVYLRAVAAGTPHLASGTWTVTSPSTNTVGWIGAADSGVTTPPTNAVFYYNLPSNEQILLAGPPTTLYPSASGVLTAEEVKHALLLKQALPAYPQAYTMLFANGVLQTANDVDHSNGAYIVDENGIWWTMHNDGYQPWQTNLTLDLQIVKLNPNYASAIVTSITSPNNSITITDVKTGAAATTGDLSVSMNLPVTTSNPSTHTGFAVQGLTFDANTSELANAVVPVINTIVPGPGLACSVINGDATISLSNFSLNGEVEDIEPEEAEFLYKGLHSYLRLKNPAINQRIGFVGKFRLPPTLPAGLNLNIKLQSFVDGNSVPSSTVPFAFEYAVTTPGNTITNAINSSIVVINNSTSPVFKATLGTVYKDSSNTVLFQIPAAVLVGAAYVNFRIARIKTSANPSTYNDGVCIVGASWVVE